jgi:membrane-associated phospholipid phosphatase
LQRVSASAAVNIEPAPLTNQATPASLPCVILSGEMLSRVFGRLRPEEGLLVIAFVASAALTIYANIDLYTHDINSRRIRGGLLRLVVVAGLAAAVPWLERTLRRRSGSSFWLKSAEFLRTILPFFMCIAVYTNLHDTVRYVNHHDIHQYLAAAEEWIFGGQPVLWAESYITRGRTEFFNFFYANFYAVAPSVIVVLWMIGRHNEARHVLLAIVLCFYSGYVLYIIFPAAPPRLYFASLGLFKVTLKGGPITEFQDALFAMMPNHADRAAFPSLHSAVSLLSLYYAWKYCQWFFPVLLVFVCGLLVSTVYLRHHWVVDLIAGSLLVPWTLWLTPRFERWWATHVQRQPVPATVG